VVFQWYCKDQDKPTETPNLFVFVVTRTHSVIFVLVLCGVPMVLQGPRQTNWNPKFICFRCDKDTFCDLCIGPHWCSIGIARTKTNQLEPQNYLIWLWLWHTLWSLAMIPSLVATKPSVILFGCDIVPISWLTSELNMEMKVYRPCYPLNMTKINGLNLDVYLKVFKATLYSIQMSACARRH
jgi:hypothetical protein